MAAVGFCSYRLQRPIAPTARIAAELWEWLEGLRLPRDARQDHVLACGLQVRVFPAAEPHDQKFLLGGMSDDDAGGWVLSELERNIRICVQEKSVKVGPYLSGYDQWWLALVDRIGYGLSEYDRELFQGRVAVPEPWSRIVIVNPLDPSRSFDL